MREKVEKSRTLYFSTCFVALDGRKSRLPKAAGAEPSGEMRDEKLHAVVARSTFPSQYAKNTAVSDHFWKKSCSKSARQWHEAHVEVKADALGFWTFRCRTSACQWHEAHFQV